MNWNDLNIRDKAAYIKAAVSNGVYNKDEIAKYYNKFQEGSYIQQGDGSMLSPGTKHLRYQFPHEMNATKFDVAKQLPWELPSFPNYGGAYNGMKEYSKDRYTNRYDTGSWVANNTIPSDNTNVYNKAKTLNDVREYNNKIQRELDNYRAYEWGDELYYNNPETLPEVEVRPSTWRNFRYGLLPENMRHMDASYTDPIYGIHYPQTAQQSVDNARNASYMIPGVGAVLTADDFREDPNYGTGALLAMQTLPYLSTAGKFLKNKYGFVEQPDSFTRGIGNEMGLRDAVQSGVLRGNPRGTVISAKAFSRNSKSNKYSQIFSSRKYPDLAQHYNNQVLVKEEFDEIKKNVNKWLENHPEERSTGLVSILRKADDKPLREFNSYDEYIKAMDAKAASLKDATTIGPDGQPLAYYYDTGINPLKDGYGYAKSDYGVQVRNASQYNPEIFDGHLHYSFPKAMSINDPNVSFYKKGPLGTTLKMNPKTGNSYLYEDLVTNPWNSFTEWQRAHPILNRTIKAPIQKDHYYRVGTSPMIDDAYTSGKVKSREGWAFGNLQKYLQQHPEALKYFSEEELAQMNPGIYRNIMGELNANSLIKFDKPTFVYRSSSNHGGTVGFNKNGYFYDSDTPRFNYYIIDSKEGANNFAKGHHGNVDMNLTNEKIKGNQAAVLLENGTTKNATAPSMNFNYWEKEGPFWHKKSFDTPRKGFDPNLITKDQTEDYEYLTNFIRKRLEDRGYFNK